MIAIYKSRAIPLVPLFQAQAVLAHQPAHKADWHDHHAPDDPKQDAADYMAEHARKPKPEDGEGAHAPRPDHAIKQHGHCRVNQPRSFIKKPDQQQEKNERKTGIAVLNG